MYRTTNPIRRPRTRLVWRKAEVVTAITIMLLAGALTLATLHLLDEKAQSFGVSVNEDGASAPSTVQFLDAP